MYAGVNGIFFDEAATDASEISYYQQAYNFVVSVNFAHTILNPGMEPDQGYLAVSIILIRTRACGAVREVLSSH